MINIYRQTLLASKLNCNKKTEAFGAAILQQEEVLHITHSFNIKHASSQSSWLRPLQLLTPSAKRTFKKTNKPTNAQSNLGL